MSSNESIYSRLGGESALREFVTQLYGFMARSDEVEQVRKMHPQDLSNARDRLFMFLSGMLGGPSLYMEAFGHPRLRRKHMHFQIGDKERDQWLQCAQYATDQLDISVQTRDDLMRELSAMADHLRNRGMAGISTRPGNASPCNDSRACASNVELLL
jgi:hemoglobin